MRRTGCESRTRRPSRAATRRAISWRPAAEAQLLRAAARVEVALERAGMLLVAGGGDVEHRDSSDSSRGSAPKIARLEHEHRVAGGGDAPRRGQAGEPGADEPASGMPSSRSSAAATATARYGRLMELHPGEDVVYEGHPTWRALLAFYLWGLVVAAVIGLVVALALSVPAGVAAAVVVEALVVIVGFLRRIGTTYMVSNQRLYIRRGILSKRVQQTRIDRVQNVNTAQTLVQRILRCGTVDFDTAGTDSSDFRFIGIASPDRVVAAVDRAQREAALTAGGRASQT
jgi:membrane protein YdbS with pleckstrin-like domain